MDLGLLHWDTTTLALAGAYADSTLAAYGRSSDGHCGNKVVKLGLEVTSRERVPLLYQLLQGRPPISRLPCPT